MNYDRDDYIDWLTEQIVATSEVLGYDIKATAAGMMAEDLCDYPPAVMKKAMRRVRAEHTGRLTLKAILDRVDEAVGRPAANEAWAAALEALDEAKTVVWTDEMASVGCGPPDCRRWRLGGGAHGFHWRLRAAGA